MAGQAERTLRPEDEISHYRIVSPLGAGGMGEVYLAQDRTLERSVALKILPPELVRNEDRVRRFVLEAKSASSLSHPNIVTIYEIGQDPVRSAGAPDSDPVHYISMELVSGKTLAGPHPRGQGRPADAPRLPRPGGGGARQGPRGRHRAPRPQAREHHGLGGRLREGPRLRPRQAHREAGGRRRTSPRRRRSPRTAAPWAAWSARPATCRPSRSRGAPSTHRSDIFSFGCILYEAATRRKPFAAETGVETMHKILNEKPVPVEEINDKAPAELRRLIRRCLAKSPDQRVQSIKDLALELREIVEEYDTLSASASSTTHVSGAAVAAKPGRTWGLPALVAAGLVAAAGLAVGVVGARRGASESATPPAFQTMRMSTQTSRGDVLDTAISPDGRYLAYVAGAAGPHRPAGATGRDRERRGGAAREGRRAREPRLLPGRELPLLPDPQAREPQLPGALPGPVARRDAARARVRRGLAGDLLARREEGRVLARRAPEAGVRLVVFDLESARRSACWPPSRARDVPGPARLVSRRHDDRGVPARAGARPRRRRSPSSTRRAASRRDFLALPADRLHEPRLAPRRPRPGRERAGPAGRPLRPGVPDRPSRRAAPAGHQRLQQLRRRLGVLGRGGHRRGPPDPARQPLARRRRGRARPADHVDHQPGGLEHRLLGGGTGDRRVHRPARPQPAGLGDRHGRRRAAAAHLRDAPLLQREGGRRRRRVRSRGRIRGPHLAHGAGRQRPAPAHLGRRRAGRRTSPATAASSPSPRTTPRARCRSLSVESGAVSRLPEEASGILGFSPDSSRLLVGRSRGGRPGPLANGVEGPPGRGRIGDGRRFRLPGPALDPTWSPGRPGADASGTAPTRPGTSTARTRAARSRCR